MEKTFLQSQHNIPTPFLCPKKRASSTLTLAVKRDANNGHQHRLVDENMVVLKMRIQEIKIKEKEVTTENCAAAATAAPSDGWMEWEKEYWCKNHDSNVYEAVGLLQTWLMNTRPSLVVGVVALLMFSTSTTLALVLSYLLCMFM